MATPAYSIWREALRRVLPVFTVKSSGLVWSTSGWVAKYPIQPKETERGGKQQAEQAKQPTHYWMRVEKEWDSTEDIITHPQSDEETMNQNWQDFLASRGARFEADETSDFGDALAELQAAASDTVLAPLTQVRIESAPGEDAAIPAQSFLQRCPASGPDR
jgi:hypothetical protein